MFIACSFTEVHYNLMKKKKKKKRLILKGKNIKGIVHLTDFLFFLIKEDIMKNIGPY